LKIVAGDIGGTHARFAIAELRPGKPPLLGAMRRYRTREHDGVASAWRAFARDSGGTLPGAAAFGVAAAIEGDVLHFPNSGWTIDRRHLAAELALSRMSLLNDFGAVAHAVSMMSEDELAYLAGPQGGLPQPGVTTVIGPGTGLGVALLLRRGNRTEVIETEAAHMGFAPLNEAEAAIADDLRERYGRVSVERVVSGPGLIEIYRNLGGGEWDVGDAGGLWSAAIDETDPLAAQSLELLVKCFGSSAGDIALAHGANAVVITGSLANRMSGQLRSSLFAGRFIAKGRYRSRMERIPVRLVTYPEPGLLGAAIAFMREHSIA
jgi:glucokinase